MKPIDFIILAAVIVIVGLVALYLHKAKAKGVKCIGCPDGAKCAGKCANCPGHCTGCAHNNAQH